MCSIVIVDDDEIIVEGLQKNIPWSSYGFDVVGTAANGSDGLRLIREKMPSIVITDITMPVMDGLTMAEQVVAEYPGTKIIFLTGYEEFDYARRALSVNAEKYLLKWAGNGELLNTAIQAREKLESECIASTRIEKGKNLELNIILQSFLLSSYSEEQKRAAIESGALSDEWNFCVALIRLVDTKRSYLGFAEALSGTLKQILPVYEGLQRVYALTCHQYIALVVAGGIDGRERFEEELNRLTERVFREVTDICPAVLAVGDIYEGSHEIGRSFDDAEFTLDFYHDRINCMIFYHDIRFGNYSSQAIVKRICEYIDEHLGEEDLSLSVISDHVHMCSSYVSTIFKRCYGSNLSKYIAKVRVEKALRLLQNTDYSVERVAEMVGFSNSRYFSTTFKKVTGDTPASFRKASNRP